MAKLSDLPDELVHIIIELSISVYPPTADIHGKRDHHSLDHNQIKGIEPALRPHLVNKQQNRRYRLQDIKNHFRRGPKDLPKLSQVSYPEGVPRNPYLALSLVNRAFRRLAQRTLFENVGLKDHWTASLFLQGLAQILPLDQQELDDKIQADTRNEGDARDLKTALGRSSEIYSSCLSEPARHVRSLQFMWNGGSLMGKGGESRLIGDIIRACPLLENIALSSNFAIRCNEHILEALASAQHIKEFVVFSNQWRADELVSRVFSKWKALETIEFASSLPGQAVEMIETIHNSIPVLNCGLRTIILTRPDLDARELSWLLKDSKESLRTLHLISPTEKLGRAGLCRVLTEHTARDLESLVLDYRNRSSTSIHDFEDPEEYEGLLDHVFQSPYALQKLKCLSITGQLVGPKFFAGLPQSLEKLACSSCDIHFPAFAKALSSHTDSQAYHLPNGLLHWQPDSDGGVGKPVEWLPNLRCCSILELASGRHSGRWEDGQLIKRLLEARGVCFHGLGGVFYKPEPRWRYEEHERYVQPEIYVDVDDDEYSDVVNRFERGIW
ncbi:hypothetical protein PGT21_023857 [Puccinia graminis f. sp. tritici]|uniref:Uncharacterized protein n=2 Tax=Puccinia graminis f. sp. tritici TaxID=56615 RepID=E3KNN4_PUCGT|nr:uncharacterized protein PGTG_11665 [Puccinia graminis f. sp. tritici CRL 75-36-700-3]EFP85909.1 hypothetical protein PGTG_11665 [Puccinia graminis f. sp. tritici CRL 75-36-700-3]KAA1073733.1 hypothetical protein PGT21_023857 [Puccinia graminis f. sp. tritici]